MVSVSRAIFVCNMPAEPREGLREICRNGIVAAGEPIFVPIDPSWERVGDNLIGPAYGEGSLPGDAGIYYFPESER